jgi:TetR/AcrR family tetracycline transcriptional repressor
VKLSRATIARTGLELLKTTGLDGLTMRALATELDVRAPTLYWHVKNKQDLLDAMADQIFDDARAGIQPLDPGQTWQDWLFAMGDRLHRAMLGYRDGARIYGGSYSRHPAVAESMELTLRVMRDGGLPLEHAARSFPVVLHYVVGFTIEQQARSGLAYDEPNPYGSDDFGSRIDPERHPLAAAVLPAIYEVSDDESFAHGLHVVIAGIAATAPG